MISESEEDMNARKGEMYKSKVLIGKDFELALDRLTPETKYYYCAWLFLNKTQYEYGSIRNFITLETTSSEITCPEKWLEWKAQNEANQKKWKDVCVKHGVIPVVMNTSDSPLKVLTSVFSEGRGR
jgi:hypothetical protein